MAQLILIKFLEEALQEFVRLKEAKTLDEKVDVFDFLLRYDNQQSKMLEDIQHPSGTYIHLATRLLYRFGEHELEKGIYALVNQNLAVRVRQYNGAPENSVPIDEVIRSLYHKHTGNGRADPMPRPQKAKGVGLSGKRKVIVRGQAVSINWAAVADERRTRFLTYDAFTPSDVLLARVESALTEKYLNIYRQYHGNSEQVLAVIDADIANAESAQEKGVLDKVRKKIVIMGMFSAFDIKHNMPVTIIKHKK